MSIMKSIPSRPQNPTKVGLVPCKLASPILRLSLLLPAAKLSCAIIELFCLLHAFLCTVPVCGGRSCYLRPCSPELTIPISNSTIRTYRIPVTRTMIPRSRSTMASPYRTFRSQGRSNGTHTERWKRRRRTWALRTCQALQSRR